MAYRFALIGCGNIASRHADQIRNAGKLVAVCDKDLPKAGSFAEKYGVKAYSEMSELLAAERPDIAVICTPNGLHAAHSILALEAGCHVLCEKPLAITVSDARRMLETAAQCSKKLFVVKQNRYNPPVMAIKALLDTKKLGTIHGFQVNCFWNRPRSYYESDWRGTLALDGGTLFTQFSHFIDLLYWWLGEIDEVQGYRSNALHRGAIEFEDNGVANIIMKEGAIGSLHYSINTHEHNFEGSFTLFGEKGTVKIGGRYLNTIEYFNVLDTAVPELVSSNTANAYGTYQGSMSNHHIVYREMLKALADTAYAVPEAAEGLKSVEMIEQIYANSPFIDALNKL